MVMFYKPQKTQVERYFDLNIESLDGHCIGIGKKDGRVWFVPNTMPGDLVKVERKETNGKKIGFATVQKYIKRSDQRCQEPCTNVDHCGGCSCQFIPQDLQIKAKIEGLKQIFSKNVGIKLPDPNAIISLDPFNYRRTCRLSTYYNQQKNTLSLGFREKSSHTIMNIDQCSILKEELSILINPLRDLLNSFSIKYAIGHVELTSASNGLFVLIRLTADLPCDDALKYQKFCSDFNANGFVQTNDQIIKIAGSQNEAHYEVNNVLYHFRPNDFIQINEAINEQMINYAISSLDLSSSDRVLDLFCGIGNFTLQIAQKAQHVCGVEVVDDMVKQAKLNATLNNIGNAEFIKFDLTNDLFKSNLLKQEYNTLLLDPGRKGADEACKYIAKSNIKKIVYVSCNPITATRDFRTLYESNFNITNWAIFDMFPNTEHFETVCLLTHKD